MPADALRRELNQRALAYARKQGLLHAVSDGASPSIIFGRDELGRHGNFDPAAYRRICANHAWSTRLNKAHTACRKMYLRSDWQWRELDCACSSDALLMNVFCAASVLRGPALRALLGVSPEAALIFGFKPRVPFKNGRSDQTEVDMKLGDLLVEAKLTESDFQIASAAKLSRYRDLRQVFGEAAGDANWLEASAARRGYQVIRGILAAHATGGRFCLLSDARRTDLIEIWYTVLRQVQSAELRTRVMLLTWQELAPWLPGPTQRFLKQKYGIGNTAYGPHHLAEKRAES